MYELGAIVTALVLLVVLLRLKVRLGRSMVFCAVALGFLLRVGPMEIWRTLAAEWQDKPLARTTGYMFVSLTALLLLVNVIGQAMMEVGISRRILPAMQGLFRSRRFALALIPMLMGLLPSPGGIMLSAPMVREAGDKIGVSRSRLAAINFHFRHQWECIWPLFPSIPLIQGMLGVEAYKIICYNLALTAAGFLGGAIFLLSFGIPAKQPGHEPEKHRWGEHLQDFVQAFWPIALAAGLYAGLGWPPAVGILLGILGLLILHRVPLGRWGNVFKAGAQLDMALLILGALSFKVVLEAGAAIGRVVEFLTAANIPPECLIFLLPFFVGFTTGVTLPSVAITFPLLLGFIGTGEQTNMALETLAFSGVLCGLFLTPVHLCIALSASYFETPLAGVILKLLGPTILVGLAGIMVAMLLG